MFNKPLLVALAVWWYSCLISAGSVLVLTNQQITNSDGLVELQTTISNYSIPIIDREFAKRLSETNILEISSCEVIDIEKGVFKPLSDLKRVTIIGNPLTTIRKGIFNDLNLEIVELRYNKISYIENQAFGNMPNLRKLDLRGNELKEWNPNWFTRNPKLCTINFDRNLLTELPEHMFDNIACSNYQEIDFNVNKIRKIHKKAFTAMKIERLNLVGNEIMDMEEDMFWNSAIGYLSLTGNPLTCSSNKFKVQTTNWYCQCADGFRCTTSNLL